MSDARSLTPLSEMDYAAIADAVMETGRGRWFLAEYAKRNRQADTEQVLSAIARLEGLFAAPKPAFDAGVGFPEAARAIAELREDLDRAGVGNLSSTRLSGRIHEAASNIIAAAEGIQEAAWTLRESGAAPDICDRLDRSATEIYSATATVEASADQIEKMADTVAMLDSSLRAVVDGASFALEPSAAPAQADPPSEPRVQPLTRPSLTDPGDIDIVEIDTHRRAPLAQDGTLSGKVPGLRRFAGRPIVDEDIVFSDIGSPAEAVPARPAASSARLEISYSEADLRAIDSLPTEERLRFFA
ncbi:MAG TPA: hypothetical protein VGO06_26650 [Bosea sp. (in: a-proteobacteria)]|jgi:hypothetical protein|uniref:hypothetical protein n=1 Tax=Bosea sp. (in: a-proteobacteria) TaxID=1871050 RepID=UPI002E0EADC2|nr:hypothetical protein [Bosea sp. (in: a-proteobacteria)]